VVTTIDAAIKKEMNLEDGDRCIYRDPDNSDQLLINLSRAKSKVFILKNEFNPSLFNFYNLLSLQYFLFLDSFHQI